jgi:hypothetical protein
MSVCVYMNIWEVEEMNRVIQDKKGGTINQSNIMKKRMNHKIGFFNILLKNEEKKLKKTECDYSRYSLSLFYWDFSLSPSDTSCVS